MASSNVADLPFFRLFSRDFIAKYLGLYYTPGKRNKVDDDSVFCFDNQKVTSAASEVSAEIIHV